jgi:outer membrane biosynthesis protein TonB
MNQAWQQPEPALARWLGYSAALHCLLVAILFFLPQKREDTQLRIQMVRLAGGGENKPGWVKPAEEPAKAIGKKPAAEVREVAKPALDPPARPAEAAEKKPSPARTAKPAAKPDDPPSVEAPEGAIPAEAQRSTNSHETVQAAGSPAVDSPAGAAGAGSDRTGATADDATLPGMRAYMRRAEQAVISKFRYPARGSGSAAVFHFFVDTKGRISELELRQSSGLPGMDKAGESAIRRAIIPPLPPSLRLERIGVTFTFRDE